MSGGVGFGFWLTGRLGRAWVGAWRGAWVVHGIGVCWTWGVCLKMSVSTFSLSLSLSLSSTSLSVTLNFFINYSLGLLRDVTKVHTPTWLTPFLNVPQDSAVE